MRGYLRRPSLRGVTTFLVLGLSACSPKADGSRTPSGGTGASSGVGGGPPSTGGTSTIPIPGTGGTVGIPTEGKGGSGGVTDIDECVGKFTEAQLAALDINIMLDISGSMLKTAGTATRWDAVRGALSAFLTDPGATDMNVGIQYFPLQKPGVPESCTSSAECGTAGGLCLLQRCAAYASASTTGVGVAVCDEDDDCYLPSPDAGTCVGGTCSADPTRMCTVERDCKTYYFGPCENVGRCGPDALLCTLDTTCPPDPGPDMFEGTADDIVVGPCQSAPQFCFHETVCDPGVYSTPAVDFVPIPASAAMLTGSIDAQMPHGYTPTGPALRGAIAHAREWALSHPGHQVVAVLATDGLPTECAPDDRSFVGQITPADALTDAANAAAEGLAGTPSIPTFVIGVFGQDEPMAQANLDRIAVAGGTQTARVVTTDGNVRDQFLEALNAIRATRLDCEFQIPPDPPGMDLDYQYVNVVHSNGTTVTPIGYVGTAANCGAAGGWYYDNDPLGEDEMGNPLPDPTRILVCEQTCKNFLMVSGGTVNIELGCATKPPE